MGIFGVSDKHRQKQAEKASAITNMQQTTTAFGQRKFAMTPGAWTLIAVIVVAMIAIAVVFKVIPIPAALPIVVFITMTKPRRVIAVGPAGYTNLTTSHWTGRPKSVIGTFPSVTMLNNGVSIGNETVMLPKKELQALRAVTPSVGFGATTPAGEAPPFRATGPTGHPPGGTPAPPQPQ